MGVAVRYTAAFLQQQILNTWSSSPHSWQSNWASNTNPCLMPGEINNKKSYFGMLAPRLYRHMTSSAMNPRPRAFWLMLWYLGGESVCRAVCSWAVAEWFFCSVLLHVKKTQLSVKKRLLHSHKQNRWCLSLTQVYSVPLSMFMFVCFHVTGTWLHCVVYRVDT